MIGEIWTYKATKPSDKLEKVRPILIIGDDKENGLKFIDINYVISELPKDIKEEFKQKYKKNQESIINNIN